MTMFEPGNYSDIDVGSGEILIAMTVYLSSIVGFFILWRMFRNRKNKDVDGLG